jgi:uncharacterized repeat protein (TIGR03803 family)
MKRTEFALSANWALAIIVATLLAGHARASGPEVTLHWFQGGSDGAWPGGGLIADAAGNLYGTTMFGGGNSACGTIEKKPLGCGTVFEMTRTNDGNTWIETVLYAFQGGSDGREPEGGLVFDSAGNLYGTTSVHNNIGQGTVFQLAPPAQQGGDWTETTIYTFSSYNDGFFPVGLIIDQQGNLYGENPQGQNSYGDVFELSPPAAQGKEWTYSVLYEFGGGSDGYAPLGGLVLGKSGNLYGTTSGGGLDSWCSDGCGTVFQLLHPTGKRTAWTERVLYAFTGQDDGSEPWGGVTFDKKGNLYGTTRYGGQLNAGTVFELSPVGGGEWTETVIHSFDSSKEGYIPEARVVLDKSGNIFGTTLFSDAFELSPPQQKGGSWIETILYEFREVGPSSLLLSKWGKALYGTTEGDGYGFHLRGMVFKIRLH